jgi:hypothetical protein
MLLALVDSTCQRRAATPGHAWAALREPTILLLAVSAKSRVRLVLLVWNPLQLSVAVRWPLPLNRRRIRLNFPLVLRLRCPPDILRRYPLFSLLSYRLRNRLSIPPSGLHRSRHSNLLLYQHSCRVLAVHISTEKQIAVFNVPEIPTTRPSTASAPQAATLVPLDLSLPRMPAPVLRFPPPCLP